MTRAAARPVARFAPAAALVAALAPLAACRDRGPAPRGPAPAFAPAAPAVPAGPGPDAAAALAAGAVECLPQAGGAAAKAVNGPPAPAAAGEPAPPPPPGLYAFVPIEGGTFTMGKPSGEVGRKLCIDYATPLGLPCLPTSHWADEVPDHRVTVRGFEIGRTEVTNDQYRACTQAGACTAAPHYDDEWCWAQDGEKWRMGFAPAEVRAGDHPVACIDWRQAEAVCRWLAGCEGEGCGLPSEAQWEYAARGTRGGDRVFAWGGDRDVWNRANYCDAPCVAPWRDHAHGDGFAYSAPVGSYPSGATPDGVLDTMGNVWEWVRDWYAESYAACGDRCAGTDPPGPASGDRRMLRGGSWASQASRLRTANRNFDAPDVRVADLGVRCARRPGHE